MTKKLAIMQPYAFPYIGYFQLISSVDEFVFLDNVSYIKRGYINRNSLSLNNSPHRFSLQVSKQSQNRFINQHDYIGDFEDFLRLVINCYSKSKYFDSVFPLIKDICESSDLNVAEWNANALSTISHYLGLNTVFRFSSHANSCASCVGQERIICICEEHHATHYFNLPGGKCLYDINSFRSSNIELCFVDPSKIISTSIKKYQVNSLSILDTIMHCSPSGIRQVLECEV